MKGSTPRIDAKQLHFKWKDHGKKIFISYGDDPVSVTVLNRKFKSDLIQMLFHARFIRTKELEVCFMNRQTFVE